MFVRVIEGLVRFVVVNRTVVVMVVMVDAATMLKLVGQRDRAYN